MTAAEINALDEDTLAKRLFECCGSKNWVKQMMSARPLESAQALRDAGADAWWKLGTDDWREAFSAHPKIGESRNLSKWSVQEQSGMAQTAAEISSKIIELNKAYEDKFGWIFIICATGKTGAEMLAALEERLPNEAAVEIKNAALEQAKIIQLRLEKLLAE